MILSFDKFERYEMPQVTLCNPNSRATEVDGKITITDTVGVLSNPSGMNLKLNFNAPHELSFDYYRHKSNDPIKQSFYDSIYDAIQTDRYIYLTDIGYFTISNEKDSDEDNIDKKSISCKSCEENELATAEGLHLKEGTYYLHTDNKDGLLDLFLPKTAGWTMGYIDPSLLTKPYYVEDTEVDNGYNFLYTTIQNMFECIVEPDIIKRTISVYSRVYYAEHHLTDVHIAKYNLLKHKIVEENDEDKYTALNVQGKDENLEIRAVNPIGKNVIYNFEPRYAWMSPALQMAVTKWQEKCESVEDEYLILQQNYYVELENLFNEEQNIEVLKGELKALEETKDAVIITVGEQQSTALDNVNAHISAKQTEINTATSAYNTHKSTVHTNYEVPINQINTDCALDTTAIDINGNTIFTVELLNELMTHIKPTNYIDDYMLVTESMTYPQRFEKAKELMDRAKSQLVKISSGQKTYSIDTRSFLFNKQFKHFSDQLCAGAIIYVETKNDIMEQLHLTGIDINFDEKSTNFTLGNKYDRSDLKALYDEALGQNSKSFSELKYIAGIIEEQQKQLDYQRNWVAELRTLTLDNVLTSEDQAIEINNRGLIGRKRQLNEDGSWKEDENGNPLFELEQVKLINNAIVFTDDNWETAPTAIGKIAVGYNSDGSVKYSYGINGKVLIGELILGNNLVLTGTGAGIKITDSNGNNVFFADENGNLVLSGTIFANAGTIAGWYINTDRIYNTSKTGYEFSLWNPGIASGDIISCYKSDIGDVFHVSRDGELYATKANITGTITAESGMIGGWYIGGDALENNQTDFQVLFKCPSEYGGMGSNGAHDVLTIYDKKNDNYPFVVTSDGSLYATKANITGTITAERGSFNGTITAENGEIGGWTINADSLYCQKDDNNHVVLHKPWNWGDNMGGGAGNVLTICNAGAYPFVLMADGSFIATKANITGTITAESGSFTGSIYASNGTIAGWNIEGGRIYNTNPNTGYTFSLWNPAVAGGNIISCDNGSDYPFYVTRDGFLNATNANIIGRLEAGSIICDDIGFGNNGRTTFKDYSAPSPPYETGTIWKHKSSSQTFISLDSYNTTISGGEVALNSNSGTIGFLNNEDYASGYINVHYTDSKEHMQIGTFDYIDLMINGDKKLWCKNNGGHLAGTWTSDNAVSDMRFKNTIETLDDRYNLFFDSLETKRYKYNHGTSDRFHTGYIAQEIVEALDNANISTQEFAGVMLVKDDETQEECWYLRRDEFVALNTWQIQRCKKKIADLENTVAELKTQLQTLTAG